MRDSIVERLAHVRLFEFVESTQVRVLLTHLRRLLFLQDLQEIRRIQRELLLFFDEKISLKRLHQLVVARMEVEARGVGCPDHIGQIDRRV